ncbi:MADS-box transcription factor [Mucor lusitanicus]|uniref:MADS-box transcription factor n=2 Tax=Mucor circinelloides f. lusitanicus TaxID=29924 RepID=A0A168NZR3_MUCCL|nr:MADS-box transcription factor [Mucor lusitanicus]OAD06956.1 MADS-box transcription factor [Mucor lusitanicus CBS 277.49]
MNPSDLYHQRPLNQLHLGVPPANTADLHQEDVDSEEDADSRPGKRSGRRKIKIEYIEDKSRRHITFSKRKAGIMKKAYELSTLTGTQVLLLVVSETGLLYTFTTPKLQPLVTRPEGKSLIQECLNAPDLSHLVRLLVVQIA